MCSACSKKSVRIVWTLPTRKFFFRHTWGVGWLDFSQKPSFSCMKSICTTDCFVVLNFSQLFFLAGKIRRPKKKIRQIETGKPVKTATSFNSVSLCTEWHTSCEKNFSHSVTLTKCVKTQQRYNRSTRVNTHDWNVYSTILSIKSRSYWLQSAVYIHIYIYIYIYILIYIHIYIYNARAFPTMLQIPALDHTTSLCVWIHSLSSLDSDPNFGC